MSKVNGRLNGLANYFIVAVLASGGTGAGFKLFGHPPSPPMQVVTPQGWTDLNVKVGRLAEAVENIEKMLARLIPKP